MKTTILIGGDTCPVGRNEDMFRRGDAQSLLGDLLPEFERADLSIVNLECPLIERESPTEKCGPSLSAPMACVNGLKAMGVDVVGLANNHIMDHDAQGLRTTIKALQEQGIAHVGAGENIEEARRILVREVNGIRIGILAVAEHEFGIASKTEPGANPIGVIDFVRNINTHRSEYDELIVLVHGGNEYYPYPRPGLMKMCRFYVEQGASAVICQHSHCVGCMETYQGSPIIYGQGNFLFDFPSKQAGWCEGMLICLEIDNIGNFETRLIPYRQADGQSGACRMMANEESNWQSAFDRRSRHLASPQMVEEKWHTFCRDNKRYYLHNIHGKPGILRRLAGKLGLLHYLDSRDIQRRRLHFIRCESLHEALETTLKSEAMQQRDKANPEKNGA